MSRVQRKPRLSYAAGSAGNKLPSDLRPYFRLTGLDVRSQRPNISMSTRAVNSPRTRHQQYARTISSIRCPG